VTKILYFIAVALALHSQPAFSQTALKMPTVPPTARDLYIGCSLYLRETETDDVKEAYTPPHSALACAGVAFNAFGYSSAIKPGNEWEYCTPQTAAFKADPLRALVAAYVDAYERLRFPEPNKQGLTMMLYMLKISWPCSS